MTVNTDKDGIWKDAIKHYLPLLLKRMMPELYADVEFTQEIRYLDKELRDTIQVTMKEEHNAAKYIDTLVQLPLKSGKSQWVLLHIEVQGEGGEDISHRMILYCCLIFAHYGRMPVALAVLTDKRPSDEKPGKFEFKEYGTELIYKYNLFEIYEQSEEELLNSDNPFDSFIYAAKEYSKYKSQEARLKYLLRITRSLQALGLKAKERAGILVLVSRLIDLEDEELRTQYFEELKKMEGESRMAELTWIEEHFRDEAIALGKEQGMAIGKEYAINAAIEFMQSRGMSNEQINIFKNSIK